MSVSTDLPIAFKFTLPYLTREGQETSLLIATGPNVTVNTILVLPFIQQTRMVIDAADQVAKLHVLDAPPFPINFGHTMCTVPAVASDSSPDSCTHTHVIRACREWVQYQRIDDGKRAFIYIEEKIGGGR